MVMTNGQEITTQLHYDMNICLEKEGEIGAHSAESLWRLGWGEVVTDGAEMRHRMVGG